MMFLAPNQRFHETVLALGDRLAREPRCGKSGSENFFLALVV